MASLVIAAVTPIGGIEEAMHSIVRPIFKALNLRSQIVPHARPSCIPSKDNGQSRPQAIEWYHIDNEPIGHVPTLLEVLDMCARQRHKVCRGCRVVPGLRPGTAA